MTRRTLTREEIDEQDFQNLVASSGSEDEGEGLVSSAPVGKKPGSKARKDKLRALLLFGNDEDGDVWGKAGTSNLDEDGYKKSGQSGEHEMEITFRPGLDSTRPAAGGDEDNLTSLEKISDEDERAEIAEKGESRAEACFQRRWPPPHKDGRRRVLLAKI